MRYVRFRPDEFISGVHTLSGPFVIGCYWMVCSLIYSQGGAIEDDAKWLAGVLKIHGNAWLAARRELIAKKKLFVVPATDDQPARLMNPRAELELDLSSHRSEVGQANANARHRPTGIRSRNARDSVEKRSGNGVKKHPVSRKDNDLAARSAMLPNYRTTESTKNGTHAPGKPEGASRARAEDSDLWRNRLSAYDPGGTWPDDWGPPPESGSCRAPQFILKKWRVDHGLEA